MRMRGSSWFKLLLVCMWFFPFLMGQGLAQDQGTGVRVAILATAEWVHHPGPHDRGPRDGLYPC